MGSKLKTTFVRSNLSPSHAKSNWPVLDVVSRPERSSFVRTAIHGGTRAQYCIAFSVEPRSFVLPSSSERTRERKMAEHCLNRLCGQQKITLARPRPIPCSRPLFKLSFAHVVKEKVLSPCGQQLKADRSCTPIFDFRPSLHLG